MHKSIIMVQHTESEHHLNGMIGACYDWELTENGKAQADRIGQWLTDLSDIQDYHMYVSDRKRALQTAEQINKYLHLSPTVTGAIREVNAGEGNGKPVAWYREHELPRPATYDPDYRPFPDAESDRDLWNRIYPFYEEIKNNNEEKILIVSHGTALSYLQTMLFGDTLGDIPRRRFIGSSGSVSQFILEDSGRVVVRYINRQCN